MAYSAIRPSADPFTIFDSPYAMALAQQAQAPGPRGYLAMATLGNKQGSGQENYLRALQDANANQLQGSQAEYGADIAKAYLGNIAPMAQAGIAGAVEFNNPYFTTNQPHLLQNDVITQNNTEADSFNKRMSGFGTAAEMGMAPSPEQLSAGVQPSIPSSDGSYLKFEPYMTPGDATDREKLEIDRIRAQAAMISARKPSGGGAGGDDMETIEEEEYTPYGSRKRKFKQRRGAGAPPTAKQAPTHVGTIRPTVIPPGRKAVQNSATGHWFLIDK